MKICSMCKESLPLDSFNKNRKKKDGLQGQCRECWKVYYKENYYHGGKEKARLLAKNKAVKDAAKAFVAQAKDVPCADCGIKYPSYVMDFDHLDPGQKSFNISSAVGGAKSVKQIAIEIAKCEVVCSNCHRIRTWGKLAPVDVDMIE